MKRTRDERVRFLRHYNTVHYTTREILHFRQRDKQGNWH